jgi:hypothetical protein
MPVLMHVDLPGITPEQYDRVTEILNLEADPPKGGIVHIAAFDDSGLHVTDVWETREDFGRFAQERLGPAIQEAGAGDGGPPDPRFTEVHNYYAPGA